MVINMEGATIKVIMKNRGGLLDTRGALREHSETRVLWEKCFGRGFLF